MCVMVLILCRQAVVFPCESVLISNARLAAMAACTVAGMVGNSLAFCNLFPALSSFVFWQLRSRNRA